MLLWSMGAGTDFLCTDAEKSRTSGETAKHGGYGDGFRSIRGPRIPTEITGAYRRSKACCASDSDARRQSQGTGVSRVNDGSGGASSAGIRHEEPYFVLRVVWDRHDGG